MFYGLRLAYSNSIKIPVLAPVLEVIEMGYGVSYTSHCLNKIMPAQNNKIKTQL